MECAPDMVLDKLWYFLPVETLMGLLAVCRRWRSSIVAYVGRHGLEVKTTIWQDYSGDYYQTEKRLRCFAILLNNILPHMPNLQRLRISDQGWPLFMDLGAVPGSCPNLVMIDMCGFDLSPDSARELGQRCRQLREVRLANVMDVACRMAFLRTLPPLVSLYIGEYELTDGEVRVLPGSLECLSCYVLTAALLDRVKRSLPKLRVLVVRADKYRVVDLSSCSSLKSVNFDCYWDEPCHVLPVGVEHVYHRMKHYACNQLTPEQFSCLKTIEIGDIFTQRITRILPRFVYLQCLFLKDMDLTQDILRAVSRLKRLKKLFMERIHFEKVVNSPLTPDTNKQSPAEWDHEWRDIMQMAATVQSLLVVTDVDNPCFLKSTGDICLSEEQFEESGHRVPEGRCVTLYTHFRGPGGTVLIEPPWGYNLHSTGRLRLRTYLDWQRDFPCWT